jgi:hypothetical protein
VNRRLTNQTWMVPWIREPKNGSQTQRQTSAFDELAGMVKSLTGSDQLALFAIDQERGALWLLQSIGIEETSKILIPLTDSPLQAVVSGITYISEPTGDGAASNLEVTVFVPLQLNGKTSGVLAILGVDPRDLGIDSIEVDLFKTISEAGQQALSAQSRLT